MGPYEETPLERVEEVGDLIARSGLEAEVLPDLRPAQWSKLIFNATVNSVAALTGLRHDFHFADEDEPADLGHLVHDLVDEGKAVAAAAGIELYEDPWEMNVLATRSGLAPTIRRCSRTSNCTGRPRSTSSPARSSARPEGTECRCRCTRRCTASSRRRRSRGENPGVERRQAHQEA